MTPATFPSLAWIVIDAWFLRNLTEFLGLTINKHAMGIYPNASLLNDNNLKNKHGLWSLS